jgi:hypothetical protein
MKHFAILVGACLFGLAGCVVETGSGSNGGSAGSTATGGSAGGGVGGGTGGSATGGTTGGGGATGGGGTGGAACESCGVYITAQDGGTLCDGTSTDLYNALSDCTCTGACKAVCTDNVCASMAISADCQNCVIDTAAGCGMQFNECSNDI